MNLLKISSLALCGLMFFSACKKPKENNTNVNPLNIDRTDPSKIEAIPTVFTKLDANDVSGKLKIAGSTKETGDFSELPDSTFSLGVISNSTDQEERVVTGSTYNLSFNIYNDIEGVYIQVEGAKDYFNVEKTFTSSSSSNFRKANASMRTLSGKVITSTSNDVQIPIEVPTTLKTGSFCITYWIYAHGVYSDPITKCINVQEFGGEGASFIGTLWKFNTANVYFNGKSFDYLRGVTTNDAMSTDECPDKPSTTKVNEYDFTFFADGTYSVKEDFESVYYYKNFNGDCVLADDSNTLISKPVNKWAYNATTKTVTLFTEFTNDDWVFWEEYRVTESNGLLALSYVKVDGDGDLNYIMNFKK